MDGIIHVEKGVGKWKLGVFRFFPPPTKDERRINEGSTKDDAAEIGEFVGLTRERIPLF
jgi:hypothetical protein